jgi:hypothetical protein
MLEKLPNTKATPIFKEPRLVTLEMLKQFQRKREKREQKVVKQNKAIT